MAALYQLNPKTLWGAIAGLVFAGGLLFLSGMLVGLAMAGSGPGPGIAGQEIASAEQAGQTGQTGSLPADPQPQSPRLAALVTPLPQALTEEPAAEEPAEEELWQDEDEDEAGSSLEPEPQLAEDQLAEDQLAEDQLAEDRVAEEELEAAPFSLQVGAYLQAENLERALAQLEKKGLEAHVVEITDSRGFVLSSVRVGSYAKRGEAEAAAQQLRRRQGLEVLIKRELAPV
jgi:cell division protein FtsN